MDIFDSLEVRWFVDDIAGAEAVAARAWFDGASLEPDRIDHYLLTERDDLGFKARRAQGQTEKIETKYRLGSLGPTQVHDRVAGNVERWRKLSLDVVDPTLERSGTWVRVAKARRSRPYRYDGATREVSLVEAPRGAALEAGCNVELTLLAWEVRSESGRALTIGLEAFGPDRVRLDALLRVAEHAFAAAPSLRLGAELSGGYPRWVNELARRR